MLFSNHTAYSYILQMWGRIQNIHAVLPDPDPYNILQSEKNVRADTLLRKQNLWNIFNKKLCIFKFWVRYFFIITLWLKIVGPDPSKEKVWFESKLNVMDRQPRFYWKFSFFMKKLNLFETFLSLKSESFLSESGIVMHCHEFWPSGIAIKCDHQTLSWVVTLRHCRELIHSGISITFWPSELP